MSKYKIYNEDCITGMEKRLEDNSIDLCVTSIPFGALFMYSGKQTDIGNNSDGVDMHKGQFGLHMRFFIEQLYRVMKPGTNVCIHIQQLLRYKVQHGYMGMRDFRGAVISLFGNHGFEHHGEVVIEKNPQIIAQRMKLHSLMFITGKKNGRMLAPCVNDYILIFQKPGESAPCPVLIDKEINPKGDLTAEDWICWARGVWRQGPLHLGHGPKGERIIPGLAQNFDENYNLDGFKEAWEWECQHDWISTGIWRDIQEIDVLQGYRHVKENDEEKHVCPLQLEVIRRCIRLYSMAGETVLDPFMGIGSTAYVAIEQDRDAVGFELKESYYKTAVNNAKKSIDEKNKNRRELF